ncbi:hypothetical protein [Streptomyces formicae]|uniref:Secreted protein n=1 Tax=Streptomyces formicae TaxID=1616117 RepID=A0A291Q8Y4_9ACTN|nr:hypothetical protein [Streptomyces formicae]ATL27894.1 hypothetical protein KY5_2876 [Streptomyces formicae]
MFRRRALAVFTLAALALSPVAAAQADTVPVDAFDAQSCRITGHTADQGPYITVTSIPHPISAQRCRELGGTVISALDVYAAPLAEDTLAEDTLVEDATLAIEPDPAEVG